MAMNVTIKFGGDAIIYEKNRLWNIVFVTDENHVLNLFENGSAKATRAFRSPGITRHLTLIPYNPVDAGRFRGNNYNTILNLSDPKLHGADTPTKSNLKTQQASPEGRELVHLLIPIGTVDGAEFADDYWYEQYPLGSGVQFIGHKVARIVTVTYDLNDGAGLGLVISDKNGSEQLTWPWAADSALELYLDNDCHHPHSGLEDFLNYYDWITDTSMGTGGSRKFVAGKVNFEFDGQGQQVTAKKNPQGNCDPIQLDPPPKP